MEGVQEIPCSTQQIADCPVEEWLVCGFAHAARAGKLRIHVHGRDRDGERRYLCRVCGRTFTLARWRRSTDASGRFASVKEQLMHEVLWRVRCDGESLGAAARRVGVAWSTADRWVRRLEANFQRDGRYPCKMFTAEQVVWLRWGRRALPDPRNRNDRDVRWYGAALAAEHLFKAREHGVLESAEYHALWKVLTDRRLVGTTAWHEMLKPWLPQPW